MIAYHEIRLDRRGRPIRSGWHHTEETRKKLSEMKKGSPGRIIPLDERKAISERMRTRIITEENRRRMSEGQKKIIRPDNRISVPCSHCGKPILLFECRIKERNFCSRDCSNKGKIKKKTFNCAICGKSFERPPSLIKLRGAGKYCSRKCQQIGHIKDVKVNCLYCGKEFLTVPAQVKRGKSKFCSLECRNKYRSENYRGELTHTWKGGISFEPYCEKFNDDLKERVREFFNHRCVECGKPEWENIVRGNKPSKLSIHHVNFDKMTCCNDVKPLFVPLCHGCHSKTNFNRGYWEERFTRLIMDHNQGMCYFPRRPA